MSDVHILQMEPQVLHNLQMGPPLTSLIDKDPAMVGLGYQKIDRDLYPTPSWMARAVIDAKIIPQGHGIWEPAAGPGALVNVARDAGYYTVASDIYPNEDVNDFTADFLTQTLPPAGLGQCAIWTNPPFGDRCKLAEKFIDHALELTSSVSGMVIMLGRSDFDFARSRRRWFGESSIFAGRLNMSKRPRWIADSEGSPRFSYAWYVWDWTRDIKQRPFVLYDYFNGGD